MALIDEVKLRLRTKSTALDTDIQDLIDACETDLQIAGVNKIVETDPLTKQAIKLYCQAYYCSDDKADRYTQAYESLKRSMALCGDYSEVTTDE